MLSLSTTLKSAAAVALLALGIGGLSATPAAASYVTTHCNDNGCFRVRCENDGDNCVRLSAYSDSDYFYRPPYAAAYYHDRARYICDADGEDCHWTHLYRDSDVDYGY